MLKFQNINRKLAKYLDRDTQIHKRRETSWIISSYLNFFSISIYSCWQFRSTSKTWIQYIPQSWHFLSLYDLEKTATRYWTRIHIFKRQTQKLTATLFDSDSVYLIPGIYMRRQAHFTTIAWCAGAICPKIAIIQRQWASVGKMTVFCDTLSAANIRICSGMTTVSEEHVVSIFRVEDQGIW
jgi:hypothetical protein